MNFTDLKELVFYEANRHKIIAIKSMLQET